MTYKELRESVRNAGYVWFDGDTKPFNLNVVGVRKTGFTDKFDDELYVAWTYQGKETCYGFECTTDAGLSAFKHNKRVARLPKGQYRSAYTLREHGGRYLSMCQRYDVRLEVERYSDPDTKLDGTFYASGINIHRASAIKVASKVGLYSEGCTVIRYPDDFIVFQTIVMNAVKVWGNKLTYTLI